MLSSAFIFLCMIWVGRAAPDEFPPHAQSGLQCADWGVHARDVVSVYEGEAGRIHCPLFSHPKLYSYARSQSSGHTLLWYRNRHDQEEPVNRSMRHRDALWIQRATMEDRGVYICMLGNMTSCVKIGVRLEVLPRQGICDTTIHRKVAVPMQRNYTFHCPNLKHLPSNKHNVTWYHNCQTWVANQYFTEVHGDELVIYQMHSWTAGNYTCIVYYQSNGQTLGYTYTFNVRGVGSGPKQPKILNPDPSQRYPVTVGERAELSCRAFLPYLDDDDQLVWWSINNKTLEELSDLRYTSPPTRLQLDDDGDQYVERLLIVSPFKSEDLHKEFRCSVHNKKGFYSRVAKLQEVPVPSVELGCGLGVTLGIMLLLFVLYRVFWLEVHLLYRSWFGTDERDTDNKEYDVYISYARNTEEEEFVLGTLRHVLEVEFGYTVCIFDRDSLPGGTVTEETLQFVSRSRRLLVILSPCSKFRDGQALLEVRAGLAAMLRGSSVRIVLLQYKPVHKQLSEHTPKMHACVKELRRARIALALVRWEGEKSRPLNSQFWKGLRLQLPVCTPAHTAKHTHTTEHTPTAKETCQTRLTFDKERPEKTALMLETLHV